MLLFTCVNTAIANETRCYELFLPFTGEDQARIQSSHPDCAHEQHKQDIQKRRKSKLARFWKRRKTLLQKAHELHKDCDVDVYLVVRSRWNNQMWQYSNGYIPPPPSRLVSVFNIYYRRDDKLNT